MKRFTITGDKSSSIYIGEKLENLTKYLPKRKIVLVTDKNLEIHYSAFFKNYPTIVIETGESVKTLKTANYIIEKLIEYEADRFTFVVGVGGGLVTDITGFVASIYMRGIDFGFVSTSLLAQVDAGIGGKNGVNFGNFKNMIGVINQPDFIICDLSLLKTLPHSEFLNGISEMIKHTLIADNQMFAYLNKNYEKVLQGDLTILEKLVINSVMIKSEIVNIDEKEKGERRKLNFGHTFAHAIELNSNISHGCAVAIGIVYAAKISAFLNYISEKELKSIINLLEKMGLPTTTNISSELLLNAISKDKKREDNSINFIILEGIGNASIEKISLAKLAEYIQEIQQ